jgi:hypothetical protein
MPGEPLHRWAFAGKMPREQYSNPCCLGSKSIMKAEFPRDEQIRPNAKGILEKFPRGAASNCHGTDHPILRPDPLDDPGVQLRLQLCPDGGKG